MHAAVFSTDGPEYEEDSTMFEPETTVEEQELPEYEPPRVITLEKEDILEELGPARAVYGQMVAGFCNGLNDVHLDF